MIEERNSRTSNKQALLLPENKENAGDLKWTTVNYKRLRAHPKNNTSKGPEDKNKTSVQPHITSKHNNMKRQREGNSNETPPSKRQQKQEALQSEAPNTKTKKRFLYAEIAKEATEIVIVRKNGDHISMIDWNKTIKVLDTDYVGRLSGTAGQFVPCYEGRRYTNQQAVIYVSDKTSSQHVRKVISEKTPLLPVSWEELEKIREEKNCKTLTGFIRGVTGDMVDEILAKVIAYQCNVNKIRGKVDVIKSDITQLGKVLYIKVNKEAFESLKSINFTISIASAGKIRFQDPRKAPTIQKAEEEHEEDMSVKDPNHEETVGKINYKKPSTKNVEIVNVIQPKTQQVTKFSGDTTEDCATDELGKQQEIFQGATQVPVGSGEYPSNQFTDDVEDYLKTKHHKKKSKPRKQSTIDMFFNRVADDLKKKNKKL